MRRYLLAAAVLTLSAATPASASLIRFIDDDREVRAETNSWVPGAGHGTFILRRPDHPDELFQDLEFDISPSGRNESPQNPEIFASWALEAYQTSAFTDARLTSSGHIDAVTRLQTRNDEPVNLSYVIRSRYSVSFEVLQAVSFTYTGSVTSEGEGRAGLYLYNRNEAPVWVDVANGESNEVEVEGTLNPGRYTLYAYAYDGVNWRLTGNGSSERLARASYGFDLSLVPGPGGVAMLFVAGLARARQRRRRIG